VHKLGFEAFLTCLCWQCMCFLHAIQCRMQSSASKLLLPSVQYADMKCTCRFDAKCKRIQAESPHGRRPAWAVRPVIVKSGDDCRQELLAVQLISTFYDIFQASLCMVLPADKSML